MTYFSQYEQDKILNCDIFRNMKNGIFCEVGSYDGIKGSNTYFFEKYLDWSGICIEPTPLFYKKLCQNRKAITMQCCAYDRNVEKEFMAISGKGEMLSGLVDKYNIYHTDRINKETVNSDKNIIDVRCIPLKRIFNDFDITVVDYLSIDTEGSEINVLRGIDFEKVHINVISVEDNYPWLQESGNVHSILIKNGFSFHKKIICDKIYVNNNLKLSQV